MGMRLERLEAGMKIPYGGDRVTTVTSELADAFVAGDRLVVVQDSGDLLHIPAAEWETAAYAVSRAADAFANMGTVTDEQISRFFVAFADRLEAPDDLRTGRCCQPGRRRGRTEQRTIHHPPDPHRQDAFRHGRRPSDLGRSLGRPRRRGRQRSTSRVASGPDPIRPGGGRVRVRRPAERLRRCVRRHPLRQHRRVSDRFRRPRHGPRDRRARPGAGTRSGRVAEGRRLADRFAVESHRMGDVVEPEIGAGSCTRIRSRGGSTGRSRPPGRGPGQPPRHWRRMDRGKHECPARRHLGHCVSFTRPQGVQHPQHDLHPETARHRISSRRFSMPSIVQVGAATRPRSCT